MGHGVQGLQVWKEPGMERRINATHRLGLRPEFLRPWSLSVGPILWLYRFGGLGRSGASAISGGTIGCKASRFKGSKQQILCPCFLGRPGHILKKRTYRNCVLLQHHCRKNGQPVVCPLGMLFIIPRRPQRVQVLNT